MKLLIDNMDNIPEKIGKYRIESILGTGAMGIVYLAKDTQIERTVAIKILHPHLRLGESGEDLEKRFIQEAKAAARCQHPNIVTIYDFGKDDSPFIVMELVDGIELKEHIKSGVLNSFQSAVDIIYQILSALAHAHDKGIVHRDIKPANIILLADGRLKVSDFGVARLDTSDLTSTGFLVGTPNYMSPEGLLGNIVDSRSDLYSVGVMLFELVTRKRFLRQKSIPENLLLLDQETHLSAKEVQGIIPVITRALQAEPNNRYSHANEFIQHLQDITGKSVNVRSFTPLETVAPSSTPAQVVSSVNDVWDDSLLDILEQSLAMYVGPMAKFLVKKNSRQSKSLEELIVSLSSQITDPQDRSQFVKQIEQTGLTKLPDSSCAQMIADKPVVSADVAWDIMTGEQQQAITKLLAFHLGPLTSRVIKKLAKQFVTQDSLMAALGKHINNDNERAKFLTQVGKITTTQY